MAAREFACIDTALGFCGLAWTDGVLTGAQLPEGDEAATRARLRQRYPDGQERAMPPSMIEIVHRLQAMMQGERVAFDDLALDMTGVPAFHQRVYQAALALAWGQTTTYGAMAAQLGEPGAARAVGQALGANPFAPIVPCHRILAAGGRSGGFSAHGGIRTKLRLLELESAFARSGLF